MQGSYVYPEGTTPPTPPAIWTESPTYNQSVSSRYMTGVGGRRIRIITDGTIYMTMILKWSNTPPGGGASAYVPGQASWFTNTYADILIPLDVTAISIELSKPNPSNTIAPTDIPGHIEIQWITDFVSQRIIAPKESSTTADIAREEGEYFFLDGDLYVATDDIAVGDTITEGTNCEKKSVGGELSDLKSVLEDIGVEPVYEEITPTITYGYTINGSGVITEASGQYSIYKVPVTPGETYYVTASTNWSAPYYAYYDGSMNLIEKGTASEVGSTVTSIINEETTAPAGSAYLVAVRNTSGETAKICTADGHEISALTDVIADVSALQDEMKNITIRNLFDPSKVVSGYYFNGSNQLIENSGSAYVNQYITINPANKYVASADLLQVLTYKSDKTFIERAYNLENAGYVMEFDEDVAFVRISRYGSQFPNRFIFSTEDAYPILTGSEGDTYSATKTTTSLTVTIGRLKIVVNKYNDSSIRAVDLWRTNDAYILADDGSYKRLWYNSDSDGVVKIVGEDDFIGGYHGDETQTAFHLLIDGVEYAESSTFTDLAFSEIMLLCESNVYHCNTSESANTIVFKRSKIIQFNHDGYTVKNNWVAQENVTLTKSYMGMLSVERYTDNSYTDVLLNGYSDNHDYKYKSNITQTSGQPDMTEVIFNTIYGDVGIVIGGVSSPGAYYGNVTNYNSSYDKRLKAYFATIDSNNGVTVTNGSVIKATATTFVR